MLSKRLLNIASFINKDDKVIDVGCDHGYLSIYLAKNNLCQDILATDVSKNALNFAIKNIEKDNLNIKTMVSDGLKSIDVENYNSIVIAGMGTVTMLDILKPDKLKTINKLILQSNKDVKKLRKNIARLGYYLEDNIIVKDNDKIYEILYFIKSGKVNNDKEIKYGILKSDYIQYYQEKIIKLESIQKNLPDSENLKYSILNEEINYLKDFIK